MPNVVPVRIPQENVNDDCVLILGWLVQDGDTVQVEQPLVEVETSKATFEITSPAAGVIKIVGPPRGELPVGEVLCFVGESQSAIENHLVTQATALPVAADRPPTRIHETVTTSVSDSVVSDSVALVLPPTRRTRFSREALDLIRQRGLNESDFAGRGLIRKSEVAAKLRGGDLSVPQPIQESPKSAPTAVPRGSAGVPFRTESLPRAKRVEAKVLSWSSRNALRSSVATEVSIRNPSPSNKTDPKTNELRSAAIIYECGRLLRKYPYLNAFCTDGDVHFYEQINIGYALDAGLGLRTPVLRDANIKSLPELVEQRRQLLVDYLNGELSLESLAAGTFTVSDLSGAGVHWFDPLIVESQSAILGVGSPFTAAGANGAAYNLILAFDHRLIEGRMAASFINELKERMLAYEQGVMTFGLPPSPQPEPCCARCSVSNSEIRSLKGFLLQAAGSGEEKPMLICTVCLSGW